jgi:hypothetical protein
VTGRPLCRGARRVLAVAALTLLALPLFAATALAQDVGQPYDPDPLSPMEAWAIYGGTVLGGFLVAVALTALSSRRTGPPRYRPGQPWEHDELWIGPKPEVTEGERAGAAVPGAGGASGSW